MAEKRVVELTDFEHRVMMKALADQRNERLSKEQSTEDLSEIILKVIDAPTEKERKNLYILATVDVVNRYQDEKLML